MSNVPAANGRPRLLISEEGLQNEVGHWFEYCKSVVDLHEDAGVECLVAMHASASPPVVNALPARPVFSRTSWSGLHTEPNTMKRYWGIITQNLLVYRAINRVIQRDGPFDLVFVPTVTIHHVIGWRALAAVHKSKGTKRLVLFFRNNAGSYSNDSSKPQFKKSTGILAWLLKSFKPLVKKGTVAFATDSERLADEYETLCGIRPEVYPSPRVAPTVEKVVAIDKTVRFSCLGPARLEKGIDLLQQAIRLHLRQCVDTKARFIIQWNQSIIGEDGAPYEPDPELLDDPRVRFIRSAMDSDSYSEELAGTDCMILPYRRSSYFARISGVAVEGVTGGTPIIYTKDTWCEDLVTDCGAGVGVEDGDVEGLAKAIATVTDSFEEFAELASGKAHEARRKNSAEEFLLKLWQKEQPFKFQESEGGAVG